MNNIIIKKPIITEKSLREVEKNVYTFAVEENATKEEIAREVEDLFKVHVQKVTTTVVKGKRKLVGRKRLAVYKQNYKKARVKLVKSEKIELFGKGEPK